MKDHLRLQRLRDRVGVDERDERILVALMSADELTNAELKKRTGLNDVTLSKHLLGLQARGKGLVYRRLFHDRPLYSLAEPYPGFRETMAVFDEKIGEAEDFNAILRDVINPSWLVSARPLIEIGLGRRDPGELHRALVTVQLWSGFIQNLISTRINAWIREKKPTVEELMTAMAKTSPEIYEIWERAPAPSLQA